MSVSVSVVVPTYNRSSMLARALSSVEAQTVDGYEIVVVDDGSTDDTRELVSTLFGRARYLYQDRRGVSAARNRGVAAAQGEAIAFLDSDDEWRPEKLELQMRALEQQPHAPLCHCDEVWVRNGRRVNPRQRHLAAKGGGWIFRKCLPLCAISPSSSVIRRSVFEELGGFDESLPACEDYDLWLRLTARYPVAYLDQKLVVKYGGHLDQLSSSTPALDRYRIQALSGVLRSGVLSGSDRQAAISMVLEKIRVYVGGARRRGRVDEASRLEDLASEFRSELEGGSAR